MGNCIGHHFYRFSYRRKHVLAFIAELNVLIFYILCDGRDLLNSSIQLFQEIETHYRMSQKKCNPNSILISFSLFSFIPFSRVTSGPHFCKITAQMLLLILRYCVNTEGTLFSFLPEIGFSSHIYLFVYILFSG